MAQGGIDRNVSFLIHYAVMKAVDRAASAFLSAVLLRMKELGLNQPTLARRRTLAFPLMYVLSSDTMGRVDWRARLLRTTVWGGVVYVFFVAKLLDILHLSGAWSIVACFGWHILVILAFLVFSFSPQSHNKPVLE